MTELASLDQTTAATVPLAAVRFVGKRLEALLDDVASGIAAALRRDVEVTVVVPDRHGVRASGHARASIGIVAVSSPPQPDRVVESVLDHAIPIRTRRRIGVPVATDERIVGAVLVRTIGSRLLDATDWSQTVRAANRWASTIDNAVAFVAVSERAANLEIALARRGVIERAKGILMEREGCDADHAFDILRDLSQRGDHKLAAVAAQVVAGAKD
jgi:ANTAR domain